MNSHKPYLLLRAAHEPEKCFELGQKTIYVGRLPDNDICITDPASSRRHCKIELDGDAYHVVDLASANGTLVNGVKLSEKTLRINDSIQIGKTALIFHDPQQGSPAYADTFSSPNPTASPSILANPPAVQGDARGLYLLYQLGRLLVSATHLQSIMDTALTLLAGHFSAQRVSLSKWDPVSQTLAPWASRVEDPVLELGSPEIPLSIPLRALRENKAILTFDAQSDPRFSGEDSVRQASIRSALCVPLYVQERQYGVLYLDHLSGQQSFAQTDIELLTAAAHLMAVAIGQHTMQDELQRQALIRSNLERFHSPDVAQTILQNTLNEGALQREVKRLKATILFSDMKGFTAMSEKLSPEEIALLLNNYLNRMTQVIFKHRGSVNKFIGDAVMAIFGAPVTHGTDQDAIFAIRAALEMQRSLNEFLQQIAPHKRFQMRIGINTGDVVAGYIGADRHLEYTVIGDAVNLASRLESLCPPGGILIGESTHALVAQEFTFSERREHAVKGKEKPVGVYEVTG